MVTGGGRCRGRGVMGSDGIINFFYFLQIYDYNRDNNGGGGAFG